MYYKLLELSSIEMSPALHAYSVETLKENIQHFTLDCQKLESERTNILMEIYISHVAKYTELRNVIHRTRQ